MGREHRCPGRCCPSDKRQKPWGGGECYDPNCGHESGRFRSIANSNCQVGGQAAEWAAKEVAPRAVGLAMEAQKHAEHVAPAVVAVARNAKQLADEVRSDILGILVLKLPGREANHDSPIQIPGHVVEWGTKEVAPRAVGLAMEAQKHAEHVGPAVVAVALNTKEQAEQVKSLFYEVSTSETLCPLLFSIVY